MKVCIITVVYNNVRRIERAINSVIRQTYKNIEYIVIDGGSTDGTVEVIKRYGNFISHWVSEPDKGVYDAFNKGIKLSTGDVIGFLNSDDFYANDTVIERVVNKFLESCADGVYGDLVYINSHGKVVRYWKAGGYKKDLLKKGWMPPHPTFFLKREIYNKYGLYRTDMKISADYDMCLRLLWKADIRIAYLPEVLVIMEKGGLSNRSLLNMVKSLSEDYRAIRDNGVGGVGVLFLKRLTKLNQFIKLGWNV